MTVIVYSTSPKTAERNWVELLPDAHCAQGQTYVFADGSSLGSYGAAVVVPGHGWDEYAGYAAPDETRNVGAELNAAKLGVSRVPAGSSVVLVCDYLGVGAWLAGHWKINSDVVLRTVRTIMHLIDAKNLRLTFVHHPGHQKDDSDFTFFNNRADRLASGEVTPRSDVPWAVRHELPAKAARKRKA